MRNTIEWTATIILWVCLIAGAIWGGVTGILIFAAWIGVGAYFVANSRSRGLLADASFLVTWPYYLIVEG